MKLLRENCYDASRGDFNPTRIFCLVKDAIAMERTVSSQDAPERFDDLLQEVTDKGDRYVVERDGVPLAAVVPFSLYRHWKRRRESFFAQMREAAERANLSEDEAIRLTDEARHAVRTEP